MDALTIQARVHAGYAKAGAVLGLPFDHHRPSGGAAYPVTPLTKQGEVRAALDASPGFAFMQPATTSGTWYALLDTGAVRAGDYLVRAAEPAPRTCFVASVHPLMPAMLVECQATVTVARQETVAAVGAVGYGGQQVTNEQAVLSGWPASLRLAGGGSGSGVSLPASVRAAGWRCLLPPSVPVAIKAGDVLLDDMGRRFTIDAAELTDEGWRLSASEVHA